MSSPNSNENKSLRQKLEAIAKKVLLCNEQSLFGVHNEAENFFILLFDAVDALDIAESIINAHENMLREKGTFVQSSRGIVTKALAAITEFVEKNGSAGHGK